MEVGVTEGTDLSRKDVCRRERVGEIQNRVHSRRRGDGGGDGSGRNC